MPEECPNCSGPIDGVTECDGEYVHFWCCDDDCAFEARIDASKVQFLSGAE